MTSPRPQRAYRLEFRQLVVAERPASVLDVGCGAGSLLKWFHKAGIAAAGVEVDAGAVERLVESGYDVRRVAGEELPFEDDSFDVVASEFCAHHFADLSRHLTEARRVARRAVWLLDPWYDLSLPSQQRMLRWDSWFKRIDRRLGRVHNEVLSVADFLAAAPDSDPANFEFRHWLRIVPVALDWFDRESAEHLAQATPEEAAELREIRQATERLGMTDDGAIVVRIAVGCGDQSTTRPAPQ
ncbi:MAG: class I SAM-dependent methyltransferase [bacterium]|nr:class I SAM-dependent methyltransferase [bacterium]